jgi:hypothetical protein
MDLLQFIHTPKHVGSSRGFVFNIVYELVTTHVLLNTMLNIRIDETYWIKAIHNAAPVPGV